MKANELRLGNWVVANELYEGKEFRINEIRADEVNKYIVFFKTSYEPGEYIADISPILLTEKWLLRFGFAITGPHATLNSPFVELFNGPDGWEWDFDGLSIAACKYVHSLQNLFYALTGEELKEKQPTSGL